MSEPKFIFTESQLREWLEEWFSADFSGGQEEALREIAKDFMFTET